MSAPDLESVRRVLKEELDERFDPLMAKFDKLAHVVYGNGTPEKGLLMRAVKLEESEAKRVAQGQKALAFREKVIYALIGTSLTLAAGWVKSYLPVPHDLADAAVGVVKDVVP